MELKKKRGIEKKEEEGMSWKVERVKFPKFFKFFN